MVIDQTRINSFVNAVEKKKNFSRNPDKVFRHIASELGELDAKMYEVDKLDLEPKDSLVKVEHLKQFFSKKVGEELLDIIFLCSYMAELYGVNLNQLAPGRMEAIKREYSVAWPDTVQTKRRNNHE